MGINQNGKASQAPFFKVLYWAQFYLYYTLTTYLRSPILTHTHVYLFADDTNAFKSNSPTVGLWKRAKTFINGPNNV